MKNIKCVITVFLFFLIHISTMTLKQSYKTLVLLFELVKHFRHAVVIPPNLLGSNWQ